MTENDVRILLLRQVSIFGTKKQLASELGISTQNLHRFLAGKQGCANGHGERCAKIIQALGLEPVMVQVLKPKEEI